MKAINHNRLFLSGIAWFIFLSFRFALQAAALSVDLVSDELPGLPPQHGMRKVSEALEAKGVKVARSFALNEAAGDFILVAGLSEGSGAAAGLVDSSIATPVTPESLLVRTMQWRGKPLVLVLGADDRGLMYALLDIADRIGWAKGPDDPFSEISDIEESPYVSDRALSIYAMHRQLFERRFHDVAQWERYLDMLASNRFNSFVVILGYSPATYLAPPYPFFFDVDGFPEVHVPGLSREQQGRNLAMLRKLIQMTHERGLNFTLGIWDHIPRRKQSPGYEFPDGVTKENLVSYTMAAVPRLLELVPDLDAIQFRMHWESGLTRDETPGFWINVLKAVADSGTGVRIDARAKGIPDEVIDEAVKLGLDFRLTTKYWMEQMGMPFHPTHIHPQNQNDRRHGYADLLRYPQRYKMHWKVWNGGTTRVLLWGNPEYVRRFAKSTFVYDGEGFEVNEPLATKMAFAPDQEPFDLLIPEHQYYDYEYERYWHFFQVWGRLSYNPDTPEVVWKREFERRFGEAAVYIERALHQASNILPRIVAYTYPYNLFPTLTGWPEKRRHESLPNYANALPSDSEQFLSIDQAAKAMLTGEFSAKIHPYETSKWFAEVARKVLSDCRLAKQTMHGKVNREMNSTITDLKLLAHLATYHSWRAKAGVSYALFKNTDELSALDDALGYEASAIDSWRRIVETASGIYHEELLFCRSSGHWSDELVELEKEYTEFVTRLDRMKRQKAKDKGTKIFKPAFVQSNTEPWINHLPVTQARAGESLRISVTARYPEKTKWIRLRYRSVTQFEDYQTLEMKRFGLSNEFAATVPSKALNPEFDFMYFIEYMNKDGRGKIYPDMEIETPYCIVKLLRD